MKNIFYLSILILLLTSCGGASEESTNTDTTNVDTAAMLPAQGEINSVLSGKFISESALPFIADSMYFVNRTLSLDTALTSEEVKYLSFGFLETDISFSGSYYFDDFYFIDSLHTADAYDQYVETIDIGMTETSSASAIQKIKIDDSTSVLLWCIQYASYAACPYSSGTILYASILYNNAVSSCTVIGEDSGGADAPYWSTTATYCNFTSASLGITKFDENGGMDDDGNETIDATNVEYELKIIGGKWILVASDLAVNQ